jgi:hypothetical protein
MPRQINSAPSTWGVEMEKEGLKSISQELYDFVAACNAVLAA